MDSIHSVDSVETLKATIVQIYKNLSKISFWSMS